MKKNKTLLIILGVLVLCACVCLAVISGLIFTGALALKPPYEFSNEEMSSEYANKKESLAGYKKVTGAGLEEFFGGNIVYYTQDGMFDVDSAGNPSIIVVYVGSGTKEFEDGVKEYKDEHKITSDPNDNNCDGYKSKNSNIGDKTYYQITCGDEAIYGYSNGERFILFSSTAGEDKLEQAIRDYQK